MMVAAGLLFLTALAGVGSFALNVNDERRAVECQEAINNNLREAYKLDRTALRGLMESSIVMLDGLLEPAVTPEDATKAVRDWRDRQKAIVDELKIDQSAIQQGC